MKKTTALLPPLLALFAQAQSHAATGEQICHFIAARHQTDIDDVTTTSGKFDLNGDGRAEQITPGEFGTAHVTTFQAVDEHGTSHELDTPVNETGGGYVGRWYVADGRGYLVTFADEDEKYIGGVFEVSKSYEFRLLCALENRVQRLFSPRRPEDKAVCEASDAILPPDPNARMTPPDTKGWRVENDKLFGPAFATTFDNMAMETKIAPVAVESGTGRGCTYGYFAFAGDDSSPAGRHQQRGDHSPKPWACPGTRFSWFKSGGKTYLRSRPANIRISGAYDDADRVNGVVDGVPRRICSASYLVNWTLVDQAPLQ